MVEKQWYVVEDNEGPWLTEEPSSTDLIIFGPATLRECEDQLCREINLRGE